MAWTIHQLRFRVISRLHVGVRKIGNVQRARPYVPARALWATLTARLTRGVQYGWWSPPNDISPGNYAAMGIKVQREIAFSYFYFTDNSGQPLYPRYESKGLSFGRVNLTPETFAWRYMGSYVSTALNYAQNAAEEGTLHEVEYIAPHTRSDGDVLSHPVNLEGYVLVAEGCALPWKRALSEIQVGGERSYGWGRLRLVLADELESTNGSATLFEWLPCYTNDGSRPRVQISLEQPLLAHTDVKGVQASGDVEPLVGRAWDDQRGAGQRVEMVGVCYAPGARLGGDQAGWFEWTTDHIWRAIDPQADERLV
jgi:hypothetical protein